MANEVVQDQQLKGMSFLEKAKELGHRGRQAEKEERLAKREEERLAKKEERQAEKEKRLAKREEERLAKKEAANGLFSFVIPRDKWMANREAARAERLAKKEANKSNERPLPLRVQHLRKEPKIVEEVKMPVPKKVPSVNMGISLALLKVAMNEPEYNFCQVMSFRNASDAIRKLEWEVTNGSELAKGAKKIKGVGKGIAALIDEYLETGEMTRNTNTKTSSVKHTETSVENSIDESDDESDESYDTDDVSSYNTEDDESDEEELEQDVEQELEQDVEPFEHDGNYYFIDAEDMVYDPYDTITPEWWYDREHDKLITII